MTEVSALRRVPAGNILGATLVRTVFEPPNHWGESALASELGVFQRSKVLVRCLPEDAMPWFLRHGIGSIDSKAPPASENGVREVGFRPYGGEIHAKSLVLF